MNPAKSLEDNRWNEWVFQVEIFKRPPRIARYDCGCDTRKATWYSYTYFYVSIKRLIRVKVNMIPGKDLLQSCKKSEGSREGIQTILRGCLSFYKRYKKIFSILELTQFPQRAIIGL